METVTIGVHDGVMHSDEILAVSAMGILYGDVKVVRTRDEQLLSEQMYRIDVGGKYNPDTNDFDHHGPDFTERHRPPNKRFDKGPLRSGFGLIWKHFGKTIVEHIHRVYYPKLQYTESDVDEIFSMIDNGIVAYVDMLDNGEQDKFQYGSVVPYQRAGSITNLFSAFNPVQDELERDSKISDSLFFSASEFGRRYLIREIRRVLDLVHAKKPFEYALSQLSQDDEVLVLDRYIPWSYAMSCSSNDAERIKMIVHPTNTGTWSCQIPRFNPRKDRKLSSKLQDGTQRTLRVHPPVAMLGLRDEALAEVTGVEDALFCHVAGFISVAVSKEGAVALARYILDYQRN